MDQKGLSASYSSQWLTNAEVIWDTGDQEVLEFMKVLQIGSAFQRSLLELETNHELICYL